MTQLARTGILFCLIGPAGSGKTTIAQKLMQEFQDLKRSISVTSRSPREGEVQGVNYHFISREEFQKKVSAGDFFEWEETHGNLYGTLKKTLSDAITSSSDLLLDIDIRGASNLKRAHPHNTLITFLLPPSSTELIKRIKGRGAVSQEEIDARLQTAKTEYNLFLQDREGEKLVDFIVLNDSLDLSYNQVKGILIAGRASCSRATLSELRNRFTL